MPKPQATLLLLLALALLLLFWYSRPGRQEHFLGAGAQPTIFVSVASYRDSECAATIRDLFTQADRPERVYVGICEQNDAGSPNEACVPVALPKNVRRVSIPHTEALGPTYARYLCSTLFRDEDWFCQIDSHTRFVKGWDTKAVAAARACPSSKPILTHYPRRVEEMAAGDGGVPVLCKSKFDKNSMLTFESIILPPPADGKPRAVPFVSGGFVFMPGAAAREVPFDPSLPHLFQGEEILHSARLWTAGYDFFTPRENIVYHFYERRGKPKFWDDVKGYARAQADTLRKVRRLLGLEPPPVPGYPYGMGSARSLQDYWKFAGVDVVRRTSDSQARFCS